MSVFSRQAWPCYLLPALLLLCAAECAAQNGSITGSVKDPQSANIAGAIVTLTDAGKQTAIKAVTNQDGIYEFPTLRPGGYSLMVEAPGFDTEQVASLTLEVDQRRRADFSMRVSGTSTTVNVNAEGAGVQTDSTAIGDVMDSKKISDVPLNGRFFLDLAVLAPGSVLGSTNNRNGSTAASAFGAFSINSSGARSDSASFVLDGINLNDGTQIEFQPSIEAVQEFKVDSNAFSAEYGRTSGIIITGVVKSGTNQLHGVLFDYFRNDKLDALNFFDPPRSVEQARTGHGIAPFKRNIFGESLGGPVVLPGYNGKNKTFFFENYEGRRLRETETFTTTVPTLAQRAAVTNPVVQNLMTLIPAPNNPGSTVNNFTGQAPRNYNLDNITVRGDHYLNAQNLLYGTIIYEPDNRNEASSLGTHNLPGFGDYRVGHRKMLSLGYTRIFTPSLTGELHLGGNRITLAFTPQASVNGMKPADFGMSTGVSTNFPDIRISGGPSFGGLTGFPQGRTDTTIQGNYILSWLKGAHALKFGFDYRSFYNNSYNGGVGGQINFSSIANFLAGTVDTTSLLRGAVTPALSIPAYAWFVEDNDKVAQHLTLNLGFRYEYNGVARARHDQLSIFDFQTSTLVMLGTGDITQPYASDYHDFGPRVGLSWDPFGKGRTVVRAGAGIYYDEPLLGAISGMASNPPFSSNSTYTYTGISLANPFAAGSTSALAPAALTPDFKGARVPQYNFNIQQEAWATVFQIGYIGSAARRLAVTRDYNQGVGGIRRLSAFGPVNVYGSVGRASYNALWLSANRKLAKGLTFDASYTFSKSLDIASTSGNAQIQNSYNLNSEKALSDFDARHRVVVSALYQIPGHVAHVKGFFDSWNVGVVGNYQSGNPFSPIITSLRSGSLDPYDRPNLVYGQSVSLPDPGPNAWFNTAAFVLNPLGQFGNAGRNILTGPPLHNLDTSLLKNFQLHERLNLQFRGEVFNVTNTPNFGQPGNTVGAANFGVIQTTRSQRGDFGSSRQIEFALKLLF